MKKQDILISILILIVVAAAVLFFVKGCGSSRTNKTNSSAASSDETANMRSGDQICYASAPDPAHLQEVKSIGLVYADNELIVQLSDPLSEKEAAALAEENGAELVGFINVSGTCQWRFREERTMDDLEKLCKKLSGESGIEAAFLQTISQGTETRRRPNPKFPSDEIPNEGDSFNNKVRSRWGYVDIHAKAAYDAKDKMKTPVNLGIYDSLFADNTAELNHFTYGCTVYTGSLGEKIDAHGTHVSGIAAAESGNGKGIAGVYPCTDKAGFYANSWVSPDYDALTDKSIKEAIDAKLYGESLDGKSLMENMRDFAWFFYHDVKVVNCSFGLKDSWIRKIAQERNNSNGSIGDLEKYYLQLPAECYTVFFDRFVKAGYEFLIVTTAGNSSNRMLTNNETYDAGYSSALNYISKNTIAKRILVVGAYNQNRKLYAECNLGSRIDIVAPGVNIYSTVGNNKLKEETGTSMAAPYVTGTIASLWALDASRSALEIRDLLLRTGTVMNQDDHIIDGKSASSFLRLDVKKSIDLALNGGTREAKIVKKMIPESTKKEGTEVVQLRVFRKTADSYEELKTVNVTVTGEDGVVYYNKERIAFSPEEQIEYETDRLKYFGESSAFFLALPKGTYQVQLDIDGNPEPVVIRGLDPRKPYYEEKGLRKLLLQVLGENEGTVPQWDFVIETETDETIFTEFIKQQNYRFVKTDTFSSVPSPAWTGAEDPGWTEEDLTGVLSMDIADYDKDGKKELLVLSLDNVSETWYGSSIRTTYLTMQMYEIRGTAPELNDEKRIAISRSYLQTLMVSDQLCCFTISTGDGVSIVLNSQQWCEESAQTLSIYEYDGRFRYAKGTAFLEMGEGDLYFWTANKASDGLSATQALELLNDPGQWDLQDLYLIDEHNWKPADYYTIKDFSDDYLKELSWTYTDERIFDPSPSGDFVSDYNRIHSLTANDIFGNKDLPGYHPLFTIFLRHQLEQSPSWALLCTDESMAAAFR